MIKFIEIDVEAMDDDFNKVLPSLQILVLPTFIFYHDGKVVDRISGSDAIGLNKKTEYMLEL